MMVGLPDEALESMSNNLHLSASTLMLLRADTEMCSILC